MVIPLPPPDTPRDIPAALLDVLKDPSTSEWLREAVIHNALRDPVDARRDAERLLRVVDAWLDWCIDEVISDANHAELELIEQEEWYAPVSR